MCLSELLLFSSLQLLLSLTCWKPVNATESPTGPQSQQQCEGEQVSRSGPDQVTLDFPNYSLPDSDSTTTMVTCRWCAAAVMTSTGSDVGYEDVLMC